VKLAAIGVGLAADLGPADAASIVVLGSVRKDQEELLPNRICLLAARTEETRRLELEEAVYHVVILYSDSVGANQGVGFLYAPCG
jgi:hypothetical protein